MPPLSSPWDDAEVGRLAEALARGAVVAVPTETVYGLVCALAVEPVAQLRAIKGRAAEKALPVLVTDATMAMGVARWTPLAQALAVAFWPGPLTLVLEAAPGLPAGVPAGDGTVGLRAPAHALVQALLLRLGKPLASSSANRSGEPPCISVADIENTFGSAVVAPLASMGDGPAPGGVPSTVVDARGAEPVVLRHGAVEERELRAAAARSRDRARRFPGR
jgi:L-threonylcarbamoyladenylate synthase